MNLNKISDATKILIIAGTIIIVCVIVALGFKMINEGRASAGSGINQFNSMTSEYADVNLANYDGANVLGSEVVNFIKKAKDGKYTFTIQVSTKMQPTLFSCYTPPSGVATEGTITLQTDKTHTNYINPNAQFLGKVIKNKNGITTIVTFTQTN